MTKFNFFSLMLVATLSISLFCKGQDMDTAVDSRTKYIYLTDTAGRSISLCDFSDKAVVVDFWFTGCGACTHFYKTVFRELKKQFNSDDRVVFVSVSADKDIEQWRKSIADGAYTSHDIVNLYTGGRGFQHGIFTHFGISRFPSLVVIGSNGHTLVNNGANNSRCCSIEQVVDQINAALGK